MTARAPFLGSTMRWALGLTFVQVNATEASRGAGLRSDGIVDADRSCLFNRCSARLITIVSRSPVCAATVIYSERDKFFFKLSVNPGDIQR
jgi:hypothetical protein